jgi:hypothetical protein
MMTQLVVATVLIEIPLDLNGMTLQEFVSASFDGINTYSTAEHPFFIHNVKVEETK